MNRKEGFSVLGVPVGASKDDIDKAYKKLAMQWHPDVNKSPNAEKKMREINQAYEVVNKPFTPFGEIFTDFNKQFWNIKFTNSTTSLTLDLDNAADAQKIVDLLRMRGFIIKSWRVETRG